MRVIVTGGLGYIGSVVASSLLEKGHDVLIIDDARDSVAAGRFAPNLVIRQSIGKMNHRELNDFDPDIVMHFAASGALRSGEGDLGGYLDNNVGELRAFLQELALTKCKGFINSGTGAVYGSSESCIREDHRTVPDSWYGWTKLLAEEYLARALEHQMEVVRFRFFNVAGAGYGIAEKRWNEEHLIPKALDAAQSGAPFHLLGQNHGTADGTCVRDFVHVLDIADAHLRAAKRILEDGGLPSVINLGSGTGYSVGEVISTVEEVVGSKLNVIHMPARKGDSACRVADPGLAEASLGWKAQRRLRAMIEDAWDART